MKGRKMGVLGKITFANLKQNKRRTFFTILGLTLAVALIFAVAGMAASVFQTFSDLGYYNEETISEDAKRELFAVGAIVVGIIMTTSVFAIKNSFAISANERQKEFGMLASIGATRRQIRQSVILEGLMIWLIGMPIGILIGVAATAILVQLTNGLIGEALEGSLKLCLPGWVFPTTAVLGLITILLSALIPAVKISKVAPVEAIRGSRVNDKTLKNYKVSKFTREFFGIGGVIASKNLKRSRKKYRTTVVSIALTVATVIGLATFMDQAFYTLKLQFQNIHYNLQIYNLSAEKYEMVREKYDLKTEKCYEIVGEGEADFVELPGVYCATAKDKRAVIDGVFELSEEDPEFRAAFAEDVELIIDTTRNMYILVAIFLYGFVIVVALIGVTNIFNTINANVMLRAQDFASLKSVGMTSHEFNRMVRLESLMYSTKALLIGIPCGLVLSGLFYKAMSGVHDFGYRLPVDAILICVILVAALVWGIMRYSVRLINRQNIIETIRQDNI